MFLIQDEHRLPLQSAIAGGTGVWAVMEQWMPGDLLVLRVAEKGSRAIPSVVWMGLHRGAASLDQFLDGPSVLRGAAVVSTNGAQRVDQWHLDPLREIRVGVSERSQSSQWLIVTQFTTTAGRTFSVPHGVAAGYQRGRRVWHSPAEPSKQ